ncbi:MAG TPA: phosphoribosyltransferase family protein [Streptosporangiaceae bacterium]
MFANVPVTAAPPLFADRRAAGRLLAARLRHVLASPESQQAGREPAGASPAPAARPLVLALPRGGVPVAREIADALGSPLDVLVTRKIGYPPQPELGVGAIAEGGGPVYDDEFLRRLGLSRGDLAPVVARERAELDRRVRVYRGGRPPPEVEGRLVILVDDGLATGVTARAALRSLRSRLAGRTVLAIPVAAPSSAAAMLREANSVVALALPETFRAVGEWYVSFGQLTDSDVLELLDRDGEAG